MGLRQDDSAPDDANEQYGIDKEFLASPIDSTVDKFQLVPEFLKVRGLVREHLESYNYFVTTGIHRIVAVNRRVESRYNKEIFLEYKKVRIEEPKYFGVPITPQMCRLTDMTYGAAILADIDYVKESNGQRRIEHKTGLVIGRLPVMLRSCRCVLYGKDESELAKLGECPLDPGGYFVVKGNEKVILIQEQLSNNRIITDVDRKGNLIASVTSSTAITRSKTVFVMEKEKIYLQLNQLQSKVPIMVVMKAMGMECDQDVVQMVGRDPRYSALLLPSIVECASEGVITQQQALEFLEKRVRITQYYSAPAEQESKALKMLRDTFIAHVPRHRAGIEGPGQAYST